MATFFNLGFDQLEDVPMVVNKDVKKIEKLNPDGTRSECKFTVENGIVRADEMMNTLIPVVLFIS